MRLARKFMARYSHPKSPHKFTQAQLMTCLVLRAYLKTTYRGVIEILETSGELQRAIGVSGCPHYSTLKRFADRSATAEIINAMLADIVRLVVENTGVSVDEIAIDSTGLETTSASAHYRTRTGRKRKQYIKTSLSVVCGLLLPVGLVVDWGPCNDKAEASDLLKKTAAAVQPKSLFADAGYDAEWVHRFCREHWGVRSFIKPVVHRKDGGLNGRYRSQMTPRRLKHNGYGRRWHVESFISGLKRTTGSTLLARNESSLFTEAAIRVLAYALRR